MMICGGCQGIANSTHTKLPGSAVNVERLVSTAVLRAGGLPVSYKNFEEALAQEPSDFYEKVAQANAKYYEKHGWHK